MASYAEDLRGCGTPGKVLSRKDIEAQQDWYQDPRKEKLEFQKSKRLDQEIPEKD